MHYLPEALQALKTLYFKTDQKGMMTRNNSRILAEFVKVETVLPEADPLLSQYVSLTEKGLEFCEKTW